MPLVEIILFALIPLASIVGGIFYKKFPSIPQDNAIEEGIEVVIHEYSGQDIDLSPHTPEQKKDGNGNK